MAIKLADTARPNNYVDDEHLGTFPVAFAEDVWFSDGTRLSDKVFNGQSIQVAELPLASVTEEGHVYQYLGETGTYTHGCFYECKEKNSSYDWEILQTVENCVFYTNRNLVDSTVYPVGTTMVYTGEPQWGFFKGHHYMYDENKTMTAYNFTCIYKGNRVSVSFADKELKVGTTRLRNFDGYIVDYVSEINGDTVTVTDRNGSTETLTELVFTEETEEITFTGWFDIGGGGSGDGGTDYEEFIGTQAEWDALSQAEKDKYNGKIVNITDRDSGCSATNVVEENNMNAVTSNAVYHKFEEINPIVTYKNISLNNQNVPNISAISGQGLRAIRMGNVLMLNYYLKVTAKPTAVTSKTFFDLSSLNSLLNTGESIMEESKLPRVDSFLVSDQTGSSSGEVSMDGLNKITIPANRTCNIIGQVILAIKHS